MRIEIKNMCKPSKFLEDNKGFVKYFYLFPVIASLCIAKEGFYIYFAWLNIVIVINFNRSNMKKNNPFIYKAQALNGEWVEGVSFESDGK